MLFATFVVAACNGGTTNDPDARDVVDASTSDARVDAPMDAFSDVALTDSGADADVIGPVDAPPTDPTTVPLTFTQIPYSDPDLVAPGRGAEQWHDRSDVDIPVEGAPIRSPDHYHRFSTATTVARTARRACATTSVALRRRPAIASSSMAGA